MVDQKKLVGKGISPIMNDAASAGDFTDKPSSKMIVHILSENPENHYRAIRAIGMYACNVLDSRINEKKHLKLMVEMKPEYIPLLNKTYGLICSGLPFNVEKNEIAIDIKEYDKILCTKLKCVPAFATEQERNQFDQSGMPYPALTAGPRMIIQ